MAKGIIIGIIVAAIAIGGYLASPLFYDTEINEPLPVGLNKLQEGLTLEKFENMSDAEQGKLVSMMPTQLREKIMDSASEIIINVSEDMSKIMAKAAIQIQKEPKTIKSGEFVGLAGHHAEGVAKVIQVGELTYLRFENFEVTNGPDLRVYITQNGDIKDGIHLEKLKGNRGSQNYSLEEIDVEGYDTVVIYCKPFGVYFAQAQLN